MISFTRFQEFVLSVLRIYDFGVFYLGSDKRKPRVAALGWILQGAHFATSYTPTKTSKKEAFATCVSI